MQCENCGSENAQGYQFCGNCGAALSIPSESPQYDELYKPIRKYQTPKKSNMGKILSISCLLGVFVMALIACLVFFAIAYATNSFALVGLPKCSINDFLQASNESIDRFSDASKRAGATARISLSSVVGEMQQIRRDYKDIKHPDCANTYFDYMVAWMDNTIDAYISFMGQEGDYTVSAKLSSAKINFQKAQTELVILKSPTFVNIPTPTSVRLPTPTLMR